MPIAAIPNYLSTDFNTASPGLRFGMYLKIWSPRFEKEKDKVEPLKNASELNENDQRILKALLERQRVGFNTTSTTDALLQLNAISVAPFTTGLGNEHPLENGFSFLNPYGLPYLPGSGVKGVMRQAARELASGDWGETNGWKNEDIYPLIVNGKPLLDKNENPVLLSMLDILFGRETADGDADHLRGALAFWDVIPKIKDDRLLVEIMTPHQKHYYQDGQSPHDSGSPTPISFLTVPPGSDFTFHVQCNLELLQRFAAHLVIDQKWKTLLQAAFQHAFEWLGFGAKTAVGYGAMANKETLRKAQEKQYQDQLMLSGIMMGSSIWLGARIKSTNPGSGEITVENNEGKLASGQFFKQISDAAKKRLKNKKSVHVDVEIEEKGNFITIKSINEIAQ